MIMSINRKGNTTPETDIPAVAKPKAFPFSCVGNYPCVSTVSHIQKAIEEIKPTQSFGLP
jgi:hypothetical protein